MYHGTRVNRPAARADAPANRRSSGPRPFTGHFPLAALLLLGALIGCTGDDPVELTVSISVSPTSTSLGAGESTTFNALVTGTSNTAVTWSATCGTVTGQGATATYTAPAEAGTCTVTATSQADPTKSASAEVTVIGVVVSITPPLDTLFVGQTATFQASVTGTDDTGVEWSADCGTLTEVDGATALYRAPGQPGTCHVTATSTAYQTRSATATVTVRFVEPFENLLGNGTFDTDISQWTLVDISGEPGPRAAWSSEDANGNPGSGSAETYNPSTNTSNGLLVALTACVPVAPGQRIAGGGSARMVNVVAGGLASPQIWVRAYSDAACTTQVGTLFELSFQDFANDTQWATLSREAVVPAGAQRIQIMLGVRKHQTGLAVDATGRFDNVFLTVLPPE